MIQLSGNIPETTAPAATIQPFPNRVPSSIVTLAPIQQSLPITTPPLVYTPYSLIGMCISEKQCVSGCILT